MGLLFEDRTINDFDVVATFGTLNYLSVQQIFERDSENNVTEVVREQNVTLYSEELNDQIEIAIPADFELSGIAYDDEVVLTGHVTALAWLNSYKGYNDQIQSEQAFKVRSAGIKKVKSGVVAPPNEDKKPQSAKN